MSRSEQLYRFYSGAGPDSQGRLLREIQNWTDDELEHTHDYIVWIFPLDEKSDFNLNAPILDMDTIRQFCSRPALRRRLRTCLVRMLRFYGLEMRRTFPLTVVRAPNFADRAANWLQPSNHNHLRIRRMLRSMALLGLKEEAPA